MSAVYSFRPQLGKKSLQMAGKMGNAMDRLTRPTRTSRSPISRNMCNNYLYPKSPDSVLQSKTFSSNHNESCELSDSHVSFRPTINHKSRQIDRHISRSPMNKSANRFDKLYKAKGTLSDIIFRSKYC
jgi:hypothetical protein